MEVEHSGWHVSLDDMKLLQTGVHVHNDFREYIEGASEIATSNL